MIIFQVGSALKNPNRYPRDQIPEDNAIALKKDAPRAGRILQALREIPREMITAAK